MNKWLSELLSNEEKRAKAKPLYEIALNESGYETMTTYTTTITNNLSSTQYFMT